jgi:hydrogenase-4 membrane subunit HyfE
MQSSLSNIMPVIIGALSFVMLILAFRITTAQTVYYMIPLYRFQSWFLALVTLLVALTPTEERNLPHLIVGPFVVIPLILAYVIEPLLAQATAQEDVTVQQRFRRLLTREDRQEARRLALPVWLQSRPAQRGALLTLSIDLVVILLAYAIAFGLLGETYPVQANSLAISIALLLLGLSAMTNKQDIISQVMGLLVMEHGMFLAGINVIAIPPVTAIIVFGLMVYIIVTLIILVVLLPELHRLSDSIEIEDQEQLKG